MGVQITKKEIFKKKAAGDISPQEIIYNKYYWFQAVLQGYGFDSLYVDTFLDTFMIMLDTYEFSEAEFDDYYEIMLDPWTFFPPKTLNSRFQKTDSN
jgi:hypothetical protein